MMPSKRPTQGEYNVIVWTLAGVFVLLGLCGLAVFALGEDGTDRQEQALLLLSCSSLALGVLIVAAFVVAKKFLDL